MEENSENQNFNNLTPDPEIIECEKLFAKGRSYYDQNKIAKAVSTFAKITRRNPRFGKAYNFLGYIYHNKYFDSEQAEKYYLTAIEFSPKWRHSYLNYIYLLRNNNRFAEAQEILRKWAALGVDEENVSFETAILFEMQGEIKKAMELYKRAALLCVSTDSYKKYTHEIERCQQKLETLQSSNEQF